MKIKNKGFKANVPRYRYDELISIMKFFMIKFINNVSAIFQSSKSSISKLCNLFKK